MVSGTHGKLRVRTSGSKAHVEVDLDIRICSVLAFHWALACECVSERLKCDLLATGLDLLSQRAHDSEWPLPEPASEPESEPVGAWTSSATSWLSRLG